MRGMDTSVSYCRPNEHAEKAWWMTIGLLIHQYFASKKSFWFCRSIVLCVLVDDDNATGYSGASASTGTLVTTNHLLLITFLAVWKEISNMHTKGKKKIRCSHVRIFRRKQNIFIRGRKKSYIFSADLFSAEIEHSGVACSISLVWKILLSSVSAEIS